MNFKKIFIVLAFIVVKFFFHQDVSNATTCGSAFYCSTSVTCGLPPTSYFVNGAWDCSAGSPVNNCKDGSGNPVAGYLDYEAGCRLSGAPYMDVLGCTCGGGGGGGGGGEMAEVGGKVIDSTTGSPVNGVKVRLEVYAGNSNSISTTRESRTDSSGDYVFDDAIYTNGFYGDFKYKLTVLGDVAAYSNNNIIVDWRYGIGSTWNAVIPKAFRANGWSSGDSRVGYQEYDHQVHASGCSSSGSGWGATDAPARRCWFALQPLPLQPFTSITGSVRDSDSGSALSGAVIKISNLTTSAAPSFTTSAADGSYAFANYVRLGQKYKVEFITPPAGYDGIARPVSYNYDFNNLLPPLSYSIPFTWNTDAGRDTYSTDFLYDNQVAGSNDCATAAGGNPAGRCIFAVDRYSSVNGRVLDGRFRNGVPGVSVKVSNLTKGTSVTVLTDGSGNFSSNSTPNFIALGQRYSVELAASGYDISVYSSGNTFDWRTSSASPITLGASIGWTWNYYAAPNSDTLVGASGYFGQVMNDANDCNSLQSGTLGRCWFVLNRNTNARVSAEVLMEYPVDGVVGSYVVSKFQDDSYMNLSAADGGGLGTFISMNSVGTNIFTHSGGNCITAFPDNKNTPSCDNFFNSNNFRNGRASVRLYSPSGMFTCQWQNPEVPVGSRVWEDLPLVFYGGNYYCQTPDFGVDEDLTYSLSNAVKWPTLVRFKIKYEKGHIVTTVFRRSYPVGNNVAGAGNFSPSLQSQDRPLFAPLRSTGILRQSSLYYWFDRSPWVYDSYIDQSYISPVYTRDGWASGSNVIAALAAPTGNDVCYYRFSRTIDQPGFTNTSNLLDFVTKKNLSELDASVSPGNYRNLIDSMSFDSSCSNMPATLTVSNFAPGYENSLSIIVAPKIKFNPYEIRIVGGPTECSAAGTDITLSADPRFSLAQNGTPVLSNGTQAGLAAFPISFPNNYQVNLSSVTIAGEVYSSADLGKLGFCNPDGTTGINRDDVDLGTLFPTYPDIPYADASLDRTFKIYIKDSNNWWQVYNGGVHSNQSSISVDSFSRPPASVLVGDPSSAVENLPNEHALTTFNTGGLVSFSEINPSSYSNFGLTNHDWSIKQDENNGGVKALDIDTVIKSAFATGSNWQNASSMSNVMSNRYSYMKGSSFTINSEFSNYNTSTNKVLMLMDASNGSGSTLNIRSNITRASGSGILFIVVNGDITVEPSVTQIDAVIYTTKNINIKSAGNDLDAANLIQGGLYTQDGYAFGRDLPNNLASLDRPAQQILFKPEIFTKKGGTGTEFPPELLESNVYWAIE
jgi:hypothetical protein